MRTSLQGIARKAKENKRHRFRDLYRLLNEEALLESWRRLNKAAAAGADRVSAREYERGLPSNIRELLKRLKEKRYKAKLVRRVYIPKGGGKLRPLGIPALEDRLVQGEAAQILNAIYEQDFLSNSFGYRPKRGALEAVQRLSGKLQFEAYSYVVEADIKGFFDHIDHQWLIRMLELRIDDGATVVCRIARLSNDTTSAQVADQEAEEVGIRGVLSGEGAS